MCVGFSEIVILHILYKIAEVARTEKEKDERDLQTFGQGHPARRPHQGARKHHREIAKSS